MQLPLRSVLVSFIFLSVLSGCHYPDYFYISNSLAEPSTVKVKYTDSYRRYSTLEKTARYKDSLIKKATKKTYSALNQKLDVKFVSSKEAEITLPSFSTILIGTASTGMPTSMDSLYITTVEKTTAYSWKKFMKASKRSGVFFSSMFTLYKVK